MFCIGKPGTNRLSWIIGDDLVDSTPGFKYRTKCWNSSPAAVIGDDETFIPGSINQVGSFSTWRSSHVQDQWVRCVKVEKADRDH